MWPKRQGIAQKIAAQLNAHPRKLLGLKREVARETLAMQMVASLRRLDYTRIVGARAISPLRADPNSSIFDPERAAMWHAKQGNIDEAFWLAFLSVHFGKHPIYQWQRVRDVYSGFGEGLWTWARISAGSDEFHKWLRKNEHRIGGAFGNHRKYESLKAGSSSGTATVFDSYVAWVTRNGGSHQQLVSSIVRSAGNDPFTIFDAFYQSMRVSRFGRLGKFDFLALVGRMGFAPIEPGRAYLRDATGPLRGARLLFGGSTEANITADILESWLIELDETLGIGMQAMEDSLCNWQKSPTKFIHFKG